jgi:hypothetical protein
MNKVKKLTKQLLKMTGVSFKQLKQIQSFNKESKFSSLNEEKIISEIIQTINIKHNFFVDIGAANGVSWSNTCLLAINGWKGLAVEYNSEDFAELAEEYQAFPDVNLSRCMVTPETVVSLLSANKVPREFGVLSLDIDSYDYAVLEQILNYYRPSLICVEINEKIPPPIKFTVKWEPEKWNPNHIWNKDYFYGQSISQLHELCTEHGYGIVDLEYNNAFLVPKQISRMPILNPEEAFKKGYLERTDRKEKFPWNAEIEEVYSLSPEAALNFINKMFKKYEGKYICTL